MRTPQRPQMAKPCSRAGPFSGGTGRAVGAAGGCVGQQQPLVGLVLVPGDVAWMRVEDQCHPLVARKQLEALLAGRGEALTAAAVGERAGVAGVVQGAQYP